MLDETTAGVFHGHVRASDDLTQETQHALVKIGTANRRGSRRDVPRTQSRAQSGIEADLSAMSSEIVELALVDASHFLDGEWAEDRALERVNDDRLVVRRSAVAAPGVLARRRVLRLDAGFWAALTKIAE